MDCYLHRKLYRAPLEDLVLEFIFENTREVIALKFPGRGGFTDLPRIQRVGSRKAL